MKIDIASLMTIKNFALKESVTTSYIYKLIRQGKMNTFTIDGVYFIDTKVFPAIPAIYRR